MMTNLFSIFDPSTAYFSNINWSSCMLFMLLTPSFFWLLNTRLSKVLNMLTGYIFNEFKPLIYKSSYVLILPMSFFIFIMFNNLTGLLSFIFTASSHLVFTLTLALPVWLGLMFWSWINNSSNTLIHLIPQGTPLILMPFMVLIETISNIIRPGTLAVRLTANMIAGHLLIVLLSSAFDFTPISAMMILEMAEVSLCVLEFAVSFIQAYVFSVLITLYAAEATN